MIDEHEIPSGSKLYFGKSARLKRAIESFASEVLDQEGFEEIATPSFSYHQHHTIHPMELIRFSDTKNNLVSLRADSTLDVVRLITKRLGRATKQTKWFYIQPVFRYPSTEVNQIGAECVNEVKLCGSIATCKTIFEKFHLQPLLHICNINIPKMIAKEFDLDLEVFEKAQIDKIFALKVSWVDELARLHDPSDLEELIDKTPKNIQKELLKMQKLYEQIEYPKVCFSPLYYVKMRYYDELYFRFIDKNATLATGGTYESEQMISSGFGIYTDAFVETLIKK